MKRESLDKHLRRVLKDGQQAYRKALAAEVRGEDPSAHWETFHAAAAALLFASYLFGSREAVTKAKIPDDRVREIAGEVQTFDRLETGMTLEGFGADYLKPIANWFRRRVPISRMDFNTLVEACRRSAGEVTGFERMNALADLRKRSPALNELLDGKIPSSGQLKTGRTFPKIKPASEEPKKQPPKSQEELPEGISIRGGTASAGSLLKGGFFVTGMNPEQTRQTRELIARVIEEKPGKSVVGKWIRKMNLGDFVTTTQAITGTHLTSARLETVLRTNTNRAATEGLAETLREPKVQAFVPLVEYSATGDNRTRETHQAFDGYIGTMEMFDRQGCAPPCGFNCRCALIPVPASRAFEKGWTDEDGNVNYAALKRHNGKRQSLIDSGQIPDPGFVNG